MQDKINVSSNIVDRILKFIQLKSITQNQFHKEIGVGNGYLSKIKSLGSDVIESIGEKYPDLSIEWLITGDGEMLKTEKKAEVRKNIIPFYSDIGSVGGGSLEINNGKTTVEYIDAGDWFPNASAAIRHYGDSMVEYPSGSILALKEVQDLEHGFILGQNYVVEYGADWNRVTKRIQKNGKRFMAYSSNEETYSDGNLIHQPFELVKIHRAWRVLGYVVKTESSNGVINVQAKKSS